ncbi:MAG TPA: DUF4145 domain-containing protein [Vicinamibacterales bacterium]|nr:DUF4145 domain-containing protein [Vicinamibacterales bacterium]
MSDPQKWVNAMQLEALNFTCGFCGKLIGAQWGWQRTDMPGQRLRICPSCLRPTYFDNGTQFPGEKFGEPVDKLPSDIERLYDEARTSCGNKAYTGAVLLLRKLLMNIAVDLGATVGETFMQYVEFFSAKGYVPPQGKHWVDHIRKKGNEANHEIILMTEEDARELIDFSEMLLKFNYEFPARVPKNSGATP